MIQENIRTDRRKWPRESVRVPARYFLKDRSNKFQDCTITSISRCGAALALPGYEFVREKAPVYLDFIVPQTVQQLSLRGQIRMKQSRRGALVVGIQFDKLLPELTFHQMIGAHERYGHIAVGNFG